LQKKLLVLLLPLKLGLGVWRLLAGGLLLLLLLLVLTERRNRRLHAVRLHASAAPA
jgi:hypothetical protein